MGEAHLRDLIKFREKNPDLEIKYLVDVNRERTAQLKAKYCLNEAILLTDYRKVLGKVDAAIVATPHAEHYQQVMELIASGVNVLVEKPMVCSLRQAIDIYEAWKKSGLVVEVGYQRHFEPPFMAAKDVVSKGGLGKLQMISMILGQNYLRWVRGSWRVIKNISCGGELIDSGSHLIDVALWVSGLAADEAFAYMDTCGTEVDINAALVAKLEGGVLLLFTVAGDDPGWLEVEIFWGEEGRLTLQPPAVLMQRRKGEGEAVKLDGYTASRPAYNFLKAIIGEEENMVPPIYGLRVQELSDAAYRSVEFRRPVKVAELYEELGVQRP